MAMDSETFNTMAYASTVIAILAAGITFIFMERRDRRHARYREALQGIREMKERLEFDLLHVDRPLRDITSILAVYNFVLALEAAYKELEAQDLHKRTGYELPQFLPLLKEHVTKTLAKEQPPKGIADEDKSV